MYDIIIVGAGPTGSSTAKELASKGYKVLLVEKMSLPRQKSCSGVLIKKSMDLVEKYFGEAAPLHTQCAPNDNRGMIFTTDEGREYKFEQPGLNIWRDQFDCWLTQKAVEAGTELRQSTAFVSCEEKTNYVEVKLKGKTIYAEQCKLLIACDGAVSTVKRQVLGTPKNYIVTYQNFCRGTIDLDYHYFYAYLQPQLSEYDAWFNVKDNYLIFGVAVKNPEKVEQYYNEFIHYMGVNHNANIEKVEKTERWIMPRIMPGCEIDYGKGRILFAGETAGFLNPMGEGISCGMESGYELAKAIQTVDIGNDYNEKDLLATYKTNTAEIHNYMIRQWRFVARMSATFDNMK